MDRRRNLVVRHPNVMYPTNILNRNVSDVSVNVREVINYTWFSFFFFSLLSLRGLCTQPAICHSLSIAKWWLLFLHFKKFWLIKKKPYTIEIEKTTTTTTKRTETKTGTTIKKNWVRLRLCNDRFCVVISETLYIFKHLNLEFQWVIVAHSHINMHSHRHNRTGYTFYWWTFIYCLLYYSNGMDLVCSVKWWSDEIENAW